jgi:hypothetical protein
MIVIGTFPYVLRAVVTPWSLDQDTLDPRMLTQLSYILNTLKLTDSVGPHETNKWSSSIPPSHTSPSPSFSYHLPLFLLFHCSYIWPTPNTCSVIPSGPPPFSTPPTSLSTWPSILYSVTSLEPVLTVPLTLSTLPELYHSLSSAYCLSQIDRLLQPSEDLSERGLRPPYRETRLE